MEYKAAVKRIPSASVFYKTGQIKSYEEIPAFVSGAIEECRSSSPGIIFVPEGFRYISFPKRPVDGEPITVEVALEVKNANPNNGTAKFKTVPETDAVCVRHKGPYDEMEGAYKALIEWMFANGHRASSPPREYYIKGPWEIRNKHEWLTEIAIPIVIPK